MYDENITLYLKDNPDVEAILPDAQQAIKTAFGDVGVTFRFICDPEDGTCHLGVYIQTPLDVPEARTCLEQFYRAWWFNQAKSLFGKLVFQLDFI